MNWTAQLADAVLAGRHGVMDADQRQRRLALNYGYLRSNSYDRVEATPGNAQILPANPSTIYVPYYDPNVVFFVPRRGFYVGGAISFGRGIFIGGGFAPFGWGGIGLDWRAHGIFLNRRPWERGWVNRDSYVHRFGYARPRGEGPRMERHELREWHAPERRGGERRR